MAEKLIISVAAIILRKNKLAWRQNVFLLLLLFFLPQCWFKVHTYTRTCTHRQNLKGKSMSLDRWRWNP